MNFKPTATKSIISSFAPLAGSMFAFNYIYCTTCAAEVLKAKQQQMASMILIGSCLLIYIIWSFVEKIERPKFDTF
ncbi:MAG: hypothetical protein WC758_01115 [Candidatus Woesearchaeota archaeon]|jgi:hypothetical protein